MGKKAKKGVSALLPVETIVAKIVGKTFGVVGDILGGSIGSELNRWEEDINQVGMVASGEYHADMTEVKDYQSKVESYGEKLEDRANKYNNDVSKLVDKMESLIAFHEIFQMALGNRIDKLSLDYNKDMAELNTTYASMIRELKAMIAKIQSEYDFVIGLTEGAFIQRIIGSIVMIIGGLMNDLNDVMSGKANGDTWKNIGMVIVLVVLVIIAIFFPPAWGLVAGVGSAMTVTYMIIVGLMILNAFMTLDGMYANGAATGAIMGVLDTIFNDILNLDDRIGSDFDKFDKDNEDYAEMVTYVKLAIALTQVYLAWSSSSTYYAAQKAATNEATMATAGSFNPEANLLGLEVNQSFTDTAIISQTTSVNNGSTSMFGGALELNTAELSNSSAFGIKFSTYGDIYDAFNNAMSIKDYISANEQYDSMKKKFEEDIAKLNAAVIMKTNKNMMKHYKDTAYFLQDQQEYIDRYIYSMVSENMYVDPYGTTPVANIRFTPDKDTRMLSFGFEEMFSEDKMAGSRGYFNNIIYGG